MTLPAHGLEVVRRESKPTRRAGRQNEDLVKAGAWSRSYVLSTHKRRIAKLTRTISFPRSSFHRNSKMPIETLTETMEKWPTPGSGRAWFQQRRPTQALGPCAAIPAIHISTCATGSRRKRGSCEVGRSRTRSRRLMFSGVFRYARRQGVLDSANRCTRPNPQGLSRRRNPRILARRGDANARHRSRTGCHCSRSTAFTGTGKGDVRGLLSED